MALLAQVHNLLNGLEVGEEERRPRFANHLEPADVAASVRRGTERIRRWRPTAAERRLASVAEELAELVTQAEAGLAPRLPRQLVHGDFWDNNVLFRHGRPVLVGDFDFMGERARIDDLALTLWCARCDLDVEGSPAQERARLRRLVAAYVVAELPGGGGPDHGFPAPNTLPTPSTKARQCLWPCRPRVSTGVAPGRVHCGTGRLVGPQVATPSASERQYQQIGEPCPPTGESA